jgi:hypothetical protein
VAANNHITPSQKQGANRRHAVRRPEIEGANFPVITRCDYMDAKCMFDAKHAPTRAQAPNSLQIATSFAKAHGPARKRQKVPQEIPSGALCQPAPKISFHIVANSPKNRIPPNIHGLPLRLQNIASDRFALGPVPAKFQPSRQPRRLVPPLLASEGGSWQAQPKAARSPTVSF